MNILRKIRQGLRDAAQVIIMAPIKLPSKVLAVARYVALAIGILEALDPEKEERDSRNNDGRPQSEGSNREEVLDETQ
ncbi:hypothetical protein [Sphingobacterium sp. SYP-B4668]|uniref:hypothetical protein n=1 Tax=Sphingobacterium sp. SYP-B4668 TaxID=2996035 RepID=UPI0022DDA487|nr:hypothetical protein [Sphingobacterium sp. SYP-B4668]